MTRCRLESFWMAFSASLLFLAVVTLYPVSVNQLSSQNQARPKQNPGDHDVRVELRLNEESRHGAGSGSTHGRLVFVVPVSEAGAHVGAVEHSDDRQESYRSQNAHGHEMLEDEIVRVVDDEA